MLSYITALIQKCLHPSKSIAVFVLMALFMTISAYGQAQYVGVNLAGADFGEGNLPGTYNVHYTYPTHDEVDYFSGKGMNVFRIPFRWERLQRSQFAELDATELARLDDIVNYATGAGASVVLDPHNYSRYFGDIIGTANLPVTAFEDFWSRVSSHYKDNPDVIFGLMNEPHTMATELWRDNANAAIAAIRATGAENMILVPGNAWTGAHSWNQSWYGTPNSVAMLDIVDSLDNFAFDLHQYFDDNSSGTASTCVSSTIGSARLVTVTNWLRQNGKRGFLGEFGVANNTVCLEAADDLLNYIDDNLDVWIGWTWWAAGPWWGDYHFSIEPENGMDKPQMAVLLNHIGPASSVETPRDEAIPNVFVLEQNYPNPFNPQTTISYRLPHSSEVSLTIYDALGRSVRQAVSGQQAAGSHEFVWDGRDDSGEAASSGIYFYTLRAGDFFQTRKLMLAR